MRRTVFRLSMAAALAFVPNVQRADVVVRTAPNSASVQATIGQFIGDLGGVNNGSTPGPLGSGFRSINWDGVSDAGSAPNNLAPNAFSGRGAIFATEGTGFQVSAGTSSGNPVRFGNIDSSYPTTFQAFSAEKLFTPLGANTMDITFVVPGVPSMAAWVNGFGAVFADVDVAGATSMDFFDAGDDLLFSTSVPQSDNGFSFVGVSFNAGEQVHRLRLTFGNNPLGPGITDAFNDLVVADDFFFGEPQPVPEPGTLALLSVGVLAMWARRSLRTLKS
jgi:hypothetical protein